MGRAAKPPCLRMKKSQKLCWHFLNAIHVLLCENPLFVCKDVKCSILGPVFGENLPIFNKLRFLTSAKVFCGFLDQNSFKTADFSSWKIFNYQLQEHVKIKSFWAQFDLAGTIQVAMAAQRPWLIPCFTRPPSPPCWKRAAPKAPQKKAETISFPMSLYTMSNSL